MKAAVIKAPLPGELVPLQREVGGGFI